MSPLVSRLVGAALVGLIAALQLLIKDPAGLSQTTVTVLQMVAGFLGLLLPSIASGALTKVKAAFKRGAGPTVGVLIALACAFNVADSACKGPVSPVPAPIVNGILTAEQDICIVVAAIAGASTPAAFAQICPSLPAMTADVIAAINAVIAAYNSFVDALPPDGLDAGPDAAPALAHRKHLPLLHAADGGR